jgi:hypothetical protein
MTMTTLTACHSNWAHRPADERFLSLPEMRDAMDSHRDWADRSIRLQDLHVADSGDDVVVHNSFLRPRKLTHWAFGQLAGKVGAPPEFLRSLPGRLVSEILVTKSSAVAEDLRLYASDDAVHALTGPKYGRILNVDVIDALIDRVGDGRTGDFRIPGEFGKAVEITKKNTTLFASDRDMFVFLADEERRIELPNRRDGRTGSLARGFFVSNSEVGSASLRITTFLFDYVCSNRIVWGAEEVHEIAIRHTQHAGARWVDAVLPRMAAIARESDRNVVMAIDEARSRKISADFLPKLVGPRVAKRFDHQHMLEEGRPVETIWDAVTAITAAAREIEHQSERVALERIAGKLLAA